MMGQRWKGPFVLALFFCSGATALVYEVVWSKFLAQMLGSTVQAQTVVLAVFMGGLALGNRLFGRRADALARPLRAYGWIEIVIGLYAFFFPPLYQAADALFVGAGSRLESGGILLLALKASLSVALLLGPTVLMGGTLPLMAAWLQRASDDAGRRSARFYSVNSLGAVCGSGLAGFWLVQALGMVGALQAAAMVNVLIGAAALYAGRETTVRAPSVPATESKTKQAPCLEGIQRHAAWIVAVTGGVSMGMEVLAARSLSLIFGSSLQSFAIVLMAFILGIGLGSAVMASSRWQRWRSERLAAVLMTTAALWIGLLVFKIESWVEIYRWARTGIASSSVGYLFHVVFTGTLAMVLLGLPAGLLGAVLPMLIRAVSGDGLALGERVGRLLTWNTLGAVAGVLFTGFILMPRAGLRAAFAILAMLLCIVAGLTLWRSESRRFAIWSGIAASLLLALLAGGGEGWRHVLSSGAFRARETEVDSSVMERRKQHVKILFYEDAPDATVTVEQGDGVGAPAGTGLRINGKPDASSHSDLSSQLLMGHLPLLARPESKDVFILGLGSGITGGAVLCHDVNQVVIAENCEPVVRAAKCFEPWNGGVLTDRRVQMRIEDARTLLKLSPQQYDVIITQPSNPWTVGVGSVFSQEYYELAARRLKEGGLVAQWFHAYEMHDGIVSLVLRTFGSVFPFVEVWDSEGGDIILLGSKQPWSADLDHWRKTLSREPVLRDLARIGITSPETLLARQLASQRTAFAIAGEGAIQRDWFPVLEYEAPKAFHMGITSDLLSHFDERGPQWRLAPPAKTDALRGLKDAELRGVFGRYASVNLKLRNYLSWRLRASGSPESEPHELRAMHCAFRPSGPAPAIPALPDSADAETRSAFAALEKLNHRDTEARRQAASNLEALLRTRSPTAAWSAAAFAAEAVRASMADGDWARSHSILKFALQGEPGDPQLQFLARILERAHRGTPTLTMNQSL